jgi:hypothetical protein
MATESITIKIATSLILQGFMVDRLNRLMQLNFYDCHHEKSLVATKKDTDSAISIYCNPHV